MKIEKINNNCVAVNIGLSPMISDDYMSDINDFIASKTGELQAMFGDNVSPSLFTKEEYESLKLWKTHIFEVVPGKTTSAEGNQAWLEDGYSDDPDLHACTGAGGYVYGCDPHALLNVIVKIPLS